MLFFVGVPLETQAKELWACFKKFGLIKDIILPKKRDRNNRRYGFVKLESRMVALQFLNSTKGLIIGNNRIYFSFARRKSTRSIDRPIPSNRKEPQAPNSDTNKSEAANVESIHVRKSEVKVQSRENSVQSSSEKIVRDSIPTKRNLEVILELNNSFIKELETSLIVDTVYEESVDTVETILEGLGFKEVLVKGICPKRFLIFFGDGNMITKEDKDFLSVGFEAVKEAKWEDIEVRRET